MSFNSRATAFKIVGAVCSYCGAPATCIDHIHARVHFEGMSPEEVFRELGVKSVDDVTNLTPACQPCNGSKSDLDIPTWLGLIIVSRLLPNSRFNQVYITVDRAIRTKNAAPWVIDQASHVASWLAESLGEYQR